MKKKLFLTLIITFLTIAGIKTPLFSQHFTFTPYYFYKSHLYFNKEQRYNEGYNGIGCNVTYQPFSFLAFSISGEYASLMGVKQKVDSALELFFPSEKAKRSLTGIYFAPQLFFYTNPENVFYGGIGFGGIFLNTLSVNAIEMPNTGQNMFLWHAFIGNRFLLFPSIIFQVEVNFASNFKKVAPVFGGDKTFSQYFITLQLGVGALF